MGFKLKRALAALGVAACVAVPVLADTSWHSNAVSGGGSVSTTAVTKKSSATGAPALVQFTEFTNYDANPSAHPLALQCAYSCWSSSYWCGFCLWNWNIYIVL